MLTSGPGAMLLTLGGTGAALLALGGGGGAAAGGAGALATVAVAATGVGAVLIAATAIGAVTIAVLQASKAGGGGRTSSNAGSSEGRDARMTNKQAREAASELGYKPIKDPPFDSHEQPVFQQGNRYISPDADVHSGGTWKMFDRAGTRLGTFNRDLSVRIGD
jgi:hypothetical protein